MCVPETPLCSLLEAMKRGLELKGASIKHEVLLSSSAVLRGKTGTLQPVVHCGIETSRSPASISLREAVKDVRYAGLPWLAIPARARLWRQGIGKGHCLPFLDRILQETFARTP